MKELNRIKFYFTYYYPCSLMLEQTFSVFTVEKHSLETNQKDIVYLFV